MSEPDQHLDPQVAADYGASVDDRFSPDAVDPAVAFLTELAGDGTAVEFAIGTGRIALPLSASGVDVVGLDVSGPMLAELRAKDGADRITSTVADMTATRLCSDASLVYLVFNTIGNLRSQQQQVACFRNAAAHLRSGGRFVVENGVPQLRRLPGGATGNVHRSTATLRHTSRSGESREALVPCVGQPVPSPPTAREGRARPARRFMSAHKRDVSFVS